MEGLCLLCKEPITNPLTLENIGNHIQIWLPERLKSEFSHLNSVLIRHIQEFYRIKNTPSTEQLVCIHCYIKEVYQWLKWKDRKIAERFLPVFSFGYKKASFSEEPAFVELVTESEESEFGICDECGEYCDNLVYSGGEWLCEECEKYE